MCCVFASNANVNFFFFRSKQDHKEFPNLSPLKELVSIFYHLMGPADETDAVGFVELLNNVSAKGVRHSSVILTPAQDVLCICIISHTYNVRYVCLLTLRDFTCLIFPNII